MRRRSLNLTEVTPPDAIAAYRWTLERVPSPHDVRTLMAVTPQAKIGGLKPRLLPVPPDATLRTE